MNSIVFYVDINDNVVKCYYHENYNSKNRVEIKLPVEAFYKVFFKMVKQYPESKTVEERDYNKVSFYDVDVDYIDKLIEASNNYQYSNRIQNVSQERKSNKIQNAPKVVRKNKFKKTAVRTTATLLMALTLFAIAKESVEHLDFNFDFSINRTPFEDTIKEESEEDKKEIIDKLFIDKTQEKKETKTDETSIIKDIINISDPEPVVLEKTIQETKIDVDNYIKLSTGNMVEGDKYILSNAYYSQSLSEIAKRYGIDPALALAVCTHERGIHSNTVDSGGAIGLFQIQVEGGWNWNNKTITAYNFETNQYEDFLITTEAVSDVFTNMQVGCMMIQNLLTTYNYDVAKSVTAYNYGSENLRIVLEKCAAEENISMEEFNDPNNIQWLKYRDIIKGGDPEYLENVFKYIPDGTVLNFTKPNGETVAIEYDNLYEENNSSFTQ